MTARHVRILIGIVLGVFVGSTGFAQEPGNGADIRTVTAERLAPDETIEIDGTLGDPVWQRAIPADGLLQREPATGAPATEATEVRVVYDAERIVIGVALHDSEPQALLQNQMQAAATPGRPPGSIWRSARQGSVETRTSISAPSISGRAIRPTRTSRPAWACRCGIRTIRGRQASPLWSFSPGTIRRLVS